MKYLLALGGSVDKLKKIFASDFEEKFPLIYNSFTSHLLNTHYQIYYVLDDTGEILNSVTNEIWYKDIVPVLENNDISWIAIDVDTEYHTVDYSSFEGDNGFDNTLLETFYVTTNIIKDF